MRPLLHVTVRRRSRERGIAESGRAPCVRGPCEGRKELPVRLPFHVASSIVQLGDIIMSSGRVEDEWSQLVPNNYTLSNDKLSPACTRAWIVSLDGGAGRKGVSTGAPTKEQATSFHRAPATRTQYASQPPMRCARAGAALPTTYMCDYRRYVVSRLACVGLDLAVGTGGRVSCLGVFGLEFARIRSGNAEGS